MGKLDIWRWAQYTLIGLLAALVFLFTPHPDLAEAFISMTTGESGKEILPIILVVAAFGGYIAGMIVWMLAVTLRKVVTWPVFFLFRGLAMNTRNYRQYRERRLKSIAEDFSEEISLKVNEHIPGYNHILLEFYKSSEAHSSYLGSKIVSSWQSCTLLLSIAGCLMLGAFLSIVRIGFSIQIYFQYSGKSDASIFDALQSDFFILIGFTCLYLLAGLALLERNRLLVRDVLISFILRNEKKEEQPLQAQEGSSGPED